MAKRLIDFRIMLLNGGYDFSGCRYRSTKMSMRRSCQKYRNFRFALSSEMAQFAYSFSLVGSLIILFVIKFTKKSAGFSSGRSINSIPRFLSSSSIFQGRLHSYYLTNRPVRDPYVRWCEVDGLAPAWNEAHR